MNRTTPDQRVGRIVKILLAKDDRRQMDVGELLGMDSGTISRALSGKRKWTLSEIESLAAFFDVSVSVFFEEPEDLVRSRCCSVIHDDPYEQPSLSVVAA